MAKQDELTEIESHVLRIIRKYPGSYFSTGQKRYRAAAYRLKDRGRIKAGTHGGWVVTQPHPEPGPVRCESLSRA